MKNIFIFSDTVTAHTLLYQVGYVLSSDIESIILMRENHSCNEKFLTGHDTEVFICASIEECVDHCDTILVSNNMKFDIRPAHEKSVFHVNAFDGFKTCININVPKWDYAHKPVIAILSLGYFTDVYYTEIMVNRILSEVGVSVAQSFSGMTKLMLNSLNRIVTINPNLLQHPDGDVIVVSIDGTKCTYAKLIDVLSEISPDLLLICVNNSYNNDAILSWSLNCVKNVDLVVRSPYILYEVIPGKIFPVNCDLSGIDNTGIYSVSESLYSTLKDLIMNRLYCPSDVHLL